MHFYPHNIADFNNATRHLTRVERSVYRDAIDLYYDTESPLQSDCFDRLCRVLLCRTDEERAALESVLGEFFMLSDSGYSHERCDAEIAKYRLNSTAKAKAGKASAEARKNKRSTHVDHVLNSVQQTNNQELITNNQELVIELTPQAATQRKKSTRLPDDWKPSREHWEAASLINKSITQEWFVNTAHKFKDYWIAKSGKDASKADWLATWRNWIRREIENTAQPKGQYKTAADKESERNAYTYDIERARNF